METVQPTLSVVLVTRDTCWLTCQALESLYAESKETAVEVVVVDNGSADGTLEIVEKRFPQVQTIRFTRNAGFAKAANEGARRTTGRYLLFLNSDVYLLPGSISCALAWMEKLPSCGVVGAQLYHEDGRPQNSIAPFPNFLTELLGRSLVRRLFPSFYRGKERRPTQPLPVDSIIGAFFLVRREVWEKLGGFDEGFFFFLEETDFCRRAWDAGYAVYHLPEVAVRHRQGATAKQWELPARIEYWRSRYRYFRLHAPAWERGMVFAILPVRLFLECVGDTLLVLGSLGRIPKWRRRARVRWGILGWHVRGCPPTEGLPRD